MRLDFAGRGIVQPQRTFQSELGAVILVRLMTSVREALDVVNASLSVNECYFVDSTAVHFWIKNSKEYKQFVQNRKDEINKLTAPEQRNYCETKKNPADIGTRGQSAIKLKENDLWLKGPERSILPPENWPEYVNKVTITPDEDILREIRGGKKDTHVLQVIV